jgi:hypothetical protein
MLVETKLMVPITRDKYDSEIVFHGKIFLTKNIKIGIVERRRNSWA